MSSKEDTSTVASNMSGTPKVSSVGGDGSDARSVCNVCGSTTLLRCSRCQKVSYCSPQHQSEDWSSHKIHCAKANKKGKGAVKRSYSATPIPTALGSKFTVDAILFAADGAKPQLVKLEYEVVHDPRIDDVENFHKPLSFDKYIGAQAASQLINQANWPYGKEYDGVTGITLIFRDNGLNDGSRPNQSVQSVCNGKPGHSWAGNMLAIYQTNYYCGQVADFNIDLLPDVVTYLKNYGAVRKPMDPGLAEMLSGAQVLTL